MKIPNEILSILQSAQLDEQKKTITLVGQLERADYLAVNKVLEACGATWNRKAKAHVIDDGFAAAFELALTTGEASTRDELAYFPTPAPLARRLVDLADIQPDDHVLEPSVGTGALLHALCAFTPRTVSWVEIDDDHYDELAESPYVSTFGFVHGIRADFLTITAADLLIGDADKPTKVIANPPFSAPGKPQLDIDHVLHAYNLMAPGGRLVSIMSAGVLFRENKKTTEFRDLVARHGSAERLPDDSFKASGTNVRTCIVTLNKPG